jgi:hypothetical protein
MPVLPRRLLQHFLQVDDKSSTRMNTHANDGGANWQLTADTRGTLPLDHDHGDGR